VKKQKSSEEAPEMEKSTEEIAEEKMKKMMQLVPVEDVYIQALQVKHPIIDWKLHEGFYVVLVKIHDPLMCCSHCEWYPLVDSFEEHCGVGEVKSSLITFHSKLNIFYPVLDHGSFDEHEKSIVEVFHKFQ
nr:hypothetical protein [Tanacetum cinerariifolium]